jgi:serine/threonine protein kinase
VDDCQHISYLTNLKRKNTVVDAGPIRSIVLEWPIRYNIAVGIANGLAYLHGKLHSYLVHGDIKASTVVVDKYLEPKIADFGWAKICQTDEKKVHTRIEGKRYGNTAFAWAQKLQ